MDKFAGLFKKYRYRIYGVVIFNIPLIIFFGIELFIDYDPVWDVDMDMDNVYSYFIATSAALAALTSFLPLTIFRLNGIFLPKEWSVFFLFSSAFLWSLIGYKIGLIVEKKKRV